MHREVHDDTTKNRNGPRSAIALINPRSGLIRVSNMLQFHLTRTHPYTGQRQISGVALPAPRVLQETTPCLTSS